MSLPFAFLGGLPGLGPGGLPQGQPLPGLAPPAGASHLTLPGLPPPQPGLNPGAPSTLPPELLQLVNGSQPPHAQHVLELLGPPGSSISRGESVPPPDAAGRVTSQSNQYASRHQAAEQRRRTRINERLDALRTLVPHAERANTACFLEEVIKYIIRLKDRNDQLEGAMDMLRACNKPGGSSGAAAAAPTAPRAPEASASQAPPAQAQTPKSHQPQPRQHRRPSNSGPQPQQQQPQQQHLPDAVPSATQPMPPANPLMQQQAPQHHLVGLPPELLSLQHKHPQHGPVQHPPPPSPHNQQHHQQLHSQLLLLQLQQQQQQQQLLQQQLHQASSQPLAGTMQGMQMSMPPFSNSLAGLPISLDVPPQQQHLGPPQLNHAHLPTMSVDPQQQHHHQQLQAQQLQLLLPPGVMLAAPPPHLGISPAELQHIQQLQQLQHLQQLQQQQQQQQLLHPQLSPSQPIAVGNGSTGGAAAPAGVVLPTGKPEQAGNGSNKAGSSQDGSGRGNGRDAGGAATAGVVLTTGGLSAVGEKALPSQQQQGVEIQQMAPVGSNGVGAATGGEDPSGAGGAKGLAGSGPAASGSVSSPASSEESRGVPPKKRKMLAL